MKKNKWIISIFCFCITFLTGIMAGAVLFRQKRLRETDVSQTSNNINANNEKAKEEFCNE